MRPSHDSPQPVSPLTAHKTWRTLEPLHGLVYFAPEAAEAFARLGLTGQRAYFASRSAAMGRAGPGTVCATFYNFNPDLVRRSMDGVWDSTDPEAVLEARSVAAGAALRRILGPTADSPELVRAASLARRAAERAGADGRSAPVRRSCRPALARGAPPGVVARPDAPARVPR